MRNNGISNAYPDLGRPMILPRIMMIAYFIIIYGSGIIA